MITKWLKESFNTVLQKGISSFIDLYGSRLFKIKNTRVIDKITANQYIFHDLDMMPLNQNLSLTLVSLKSGIIKGLVITDLYHAEIECITLTVHTSKADTLIHSILDISFLESEDNDLLTAFEDVKHCLQKYLKDISIRVRLIQVQWFQELEIGDVRWTNDKLMVAHISSPWFQVTGLQKTDVLEIDKIIVIDMSTFPTLWLDEGGEGQVIIKLLEYGDTVIKDIVIAESINIASISGPGIIIRNLIIGKTITGHVNVNDVVCAHTWLTTISQTLQVISSKLVKNTSPTETAVHLTLDGKLHGSCKLTYSGGEIKDIVVETDAWSVTCQSLLLNPLTIKQGIVTNALDFWDFLTLLPKEEGSATLIFQDCQLISDVNDVSCALDFSCVYGDSIRDIKLIAHINGDKILSLNASSLQCIESIRLSIDSRAYDAINKILTTPTKPVRQPVVTIHQKMTESMIFDSYVAENCEDFPSLQKYYFIETIIDDYLNQPRVLNSCHIQQATIDLFTLHTQPAFAQIQLVAKINQTHDLESSVIDEPTIINHVESRIEIVDLLAEGKWRHFASIPCMRVSYASRSGDHDISVYCKAIDLHIREQCLLKLIDLFTPRQIQTKSKGSIDKISISDIPLRISYSASIVSGIPALAINEHSYVLKAVTLKWCSVDQAIETIKTEWLGNMSLVKALADINIIQPCANPLYQIYSACMKYIHLPSFDDLIRQCKEISKLMN